MTQVVVLGAGAIGCHVGAAWSRALAAVGQPLCLIGRPLVMDRLEQNGLQADGIEPGSIMYSADAADLRGADLVVLAMKAHGLEAAMDQVAAHAPAKAPVISLLNGLAPVRDLVARFAGREVIAGMVPYNVVWCGDNRLHRTGTGGVALARHPMTEGLAQAGCPVELYDDLEPIQYGKLLLNLIGAVNALSGLPVYEMLQDRGYRRVYAAALREALDVYRAAGIHFQQVGPSAPHLAVHMLRAPNWVFGPLVLRKQGLDPSTMTSLAVDLAAGRKTEVETINGEISRLGVTAGMATPVNDTLVRLVQMAEGQSHFRPLSAAQLLAEVQG